MTFGEKLQRLRQRAGMSQDALAEKLGYHFSHAYPCLEIAVPTQKEDLG